MLRAKALDYALEVSSRPRQSGNNFVGGVQKACTVQWYGAAEKVSVESVYAIVLSSVSNYHSHNLHQRVVI